MAKHKGPTRRRKTPQPRLQPKQVLAPESAVCCSCGQRFSIGNVRGGWLSRTCPLCGAPLESGLYDECAQRIEADLVGAEENHRQCLEAVEGIEARISAHGSWWLAPYRWFWKKRLAAARMVSIDAGSACKTLRKKLADCAYARYYTSEWYLCTHIPLREEGKGKLLARPTYHNGVFSLRRVGKSSSHGLTAEFEVFEALLAQLRRPGSALQGARLVPNIYLPNEQAGSHAGALWSQIDCVIATRSCAFVVEVKLRHADIVASKAFENVFIKRKSSDGADKPALQDFGWALDQNAGHAVALSQHIREYPYEKIYEVLVVVGAKSFASADKRFRGNIFVGCVPNETDVLLRAIEQVVECEEEVLTQDELDALADEVIERYGDLNQQRAALHVRRLQNIHG